MAERLGELMGTAPIFEGREEDTALLSNASKLRELLGEPSVPLDTMLQWVAYWVMIGGPTLGKPTHFEQREGKF